MRRFISISLAMIVLITSIGFTVNTHYCGGRVMERSLTLIKEHLNCGMNSWDINCTPVERNGTHLRKKVCCVNQHEQFQLDETGELPTSFWLTDPVFLTTDFSSQHCTGMIAGRISSISSYKKPPPVTKPSRRILFQTFVI